MALEEVAPTLRATILAHCRLGGFEPNILSLVDEGAGIALVPTSMRKAQLAGIVFRRPVDAPLIGAGAGMVTGQSESVSGAFS